MRIQRLAIMVVGLVSVAALAEPTTRPAHPRRPPGQSDRRPWGEERERTWADAQKYFEENSPEKWKLFKSLPPEKQEFLKAALIQRYRMIQMFKGEGGGGQELLKLKTRQIQMEDDIYRLRDEIQKAGPDTKEGLEGKLRQKVRELVEARLAEREKHLERLKAMLQTESQKLQWDLANKDRLIEETYKRELSGERGWAAPGPTTRPAKHPRGE